MIEYSVLSGLLYHNELITAVEVDEKHFVTSETKIIFAKLCEIIKTAGNCDDTLLASYLFDQYPGGNWLPHLEEIIQSVCPVANFPIHQDRLKEEYSKRVVRSVGQDLIDNADVESALATLKDITTTTRNSGYDPEAISKSFIHDLENPPQTISSGIESIDHKLGGLHRSDLIVLGARPAMGKTALAVNIALKSKVPFVFFSGEQGANQLMQRMVAVEGRIPLWKMRNRTLSQDDYRDITDSVARLRKSDFYVVDKPSPSLQDIVTESRRQVHQRGAQMVVVDYLQRMKTTGDSRREAIEAAIRGLKELARELNIPVVVLAQVNRAVDNREHKHPNMGDLMESGAIEAEADQIIMLSREVVYDPSCNNPNNALVTIAKNRHGPTGIIDLRFEKECLRFEQAA